MPRPRSSEPLATVISALVVALALALLVPAPAAAQDPRLRCAEPGERWGPAGDLTRAVVDQDGFSDIAVRWAAGAIDHPARGRLPAGWLSADDLLVVDLAGGLERLPARDGGLERLAELPGEGMIGTPELSPDGRHVAFGRTVPGTATALWVTDLDGGQRQLTGRLGKLALQGWLPEGEAVLVSTDGALLVVGLDGIRREVLSRGDAFISEVTGAVVHPDGLTAYAVTYRQRYDGLEIQLLEVPLDGRAAPGPLPGLALPGFPIDVVVDDLGAQLLVMVDAGFSESFAEFWTVPLAPDVLAVAPVAAARGAASLLSPLTGVDGTPIAAWLAARTDAGAVVGLAGDAGAISDLAGLQALRVVTEGRIR